MNVVKKSLLCVAGFVLAVGIIASFTKPDYYASLQRSLKQEIAWQRDGKGSTPALEDCPLQLTNVYCPDTWAEIVEALSTTSALVAEYCQPF